LHSNQKCDIKIAVTIVN